jgi:hypothetical protein
MHDLDELRRIAHLIQQPSLEAILSTARRRRRRAIAAGTAVGAVLTVLVGGGALLTDYDDVSAPVDGPARGPMTPEKIVTGETSRLVSAATSLDDIDVRIAVWEADCTGCGESDGAGGTMSALALTTDGFASATYVASPVADDQTFRQAGEVYGPRIENPAEDLFLIVDTERPGEWLVTADGTVRRVERVTTELAPTDPRLWFRCHPVNPPPAWEESGVPMIDPAHLFPWCALDPDSATAYEWPARWNGSLTLPNSGDEPWGIDNLWQPTYAWWEIDGQRQRRFLSDRVADARGAVWNPPTGGPLFFTRIGYEPTIDLLIPGEGPAAQVVTRDAPDAPVPSDPPSAQFDMMTGTPEGSLLAVETYSQTVIWRADDLAGSDFELVHESASTPDVGQTQSTWVHEPTIVGDRIHVRTPRGVVVSDDDGRTWTEITTWR